MVESCLLCGEDLEWVAYGSCGHGVACSTCVARLRFVCLDLRCCICQIERAFVFVTKASDDLTRRINDFPNFPQEPNEGQVGSFWYHEDTQAFFDEFDEYTRIRRMCSLSCTSCDQTNFECIGWLMNHLYERHRLYMCTVCLVWRQRFICEQKLFTRAQLNQHIRSGDSEVDGSVSERGGFTGHPKCELCNNPFYGDDEIFFHMSTKICPCHICDRLHPGLGTNDVEGHFVENHIQPEDGYWLADFSIVRAFKDEAELQRHNTSLHPESTARRSPSHVQRGWEFWFDHRRRSSHTESLLPPLSVQASPGQSRVSSRHGQNSGNLVSNTVAAPPRHQTNRSATTTSSSQTDRGLVQSFSTNDGNSASAPVQSSSASARSSHDARVGMTGTLAPASSPNTQSSSAPETRDTRALEEPCDSDSPAASTVQNRRSSSPTSRSENKALSEKIRDCLFNALKDTSRKYHRGLIDARSYLEYLNGHGLTELVLELATFCPDPAKRKELIDTHTASLRGGDDTVGNDGSSNISQDEDID